MYLSVLILKNVAILIQIVYLRARISSIRKPRKRSSNNFIKNIHTILGDLKMRQIIIPLIQISPQESNVTFVFGIFSVTNPSRLKVNTTDIAIWI